METTKQILEKAKALANGMPQGIMFYWKFFDNVYEVNTLAISFNNEKTLNSMNKVENLDGFKFWAISEEGKKFIEKNKVEIGKAFTWNL